MPSPISVGRWAAATPISARSGAGTCSQRSPPPPEVTPSKRIEARAAESRSPAGPRCLGTATRISASLLRRLSAFFGSASDQDSKAAKYIILIPGPGRFANVRNAPRVAIPPHPKCPCFGVCALVCAPVGEKRSS